MRAVGVVSPWHRLFVWRSGEEIVPTFPKSIILDAQEQQTGLPRVRSSLIVRWLQAWERLPHGLPRLE